MSVAITVKLLIYNPTLPVFTGNPKPPGGTDSAQSASAQVRQGHLHFPRFQHVYTYSNSFISYLYVLTGMRKRARAPGPNGRPTPSSRPQTVASAYRHEESRSQTMPLCKEGSSSLTADISKGSSAGCEVHFCNPSTWEVEAGRSRSPCYPARPTLNQPRKSSQRKS